MRNSIWRPRFPNEEQRIWIYVSGLIFVLVVIVAMFSGCKTVEPKRCPIGYVMVHGDCYLPGVTYTNELNVSDVK